MLELFTAYDFNGPTCATGFLVCHNHAPVYQSAGVTVFSGEPGDYLAGYHSINRALVYREGLKSSDVTYLYVGRQFYRELNRLQVPADPILFATNYRIMERLPLQVVEAHPDRKQQGAIEKLVSQALADYKPSPLSPPPLPREDSPRRLAALLRQIYGPGYCEQLAEALIFPQGSC